jgi:hypothetical protein
MRTGGPRKAEAAWGTKKEIAGWGFLMSWQRYHRRPSRSRMSIQRRSATEYPARVNRLISPTPGVRGSVASPPLTRKAGCWSPTAPSACRMRGRCVIFNRDVGQPVPHARFHPPMPRFGSPLAPPKTAPGWDRERRSTRPSTTRRPQHAAAPSTPPPGGRPQRASR